MNPVISLITVVKCYLSCHQNLGKVQVLDLSLLLEMTAVVSQVLVPQSNSVYFSTNTINVVG